MFRLASLTPLQSSVLSSGRGKTIFSPCVVQRRVPKQKGTVDRPPGCMGMEVPHTDDKARRKNVWNNSSQCSQHKHRVSRQR
ncbi:hypothetical protein HYDPIDRAFT_111667 [Hydnomerulius pinastri MD-312]|uniref:Uncharacterized protein n=1 Tax=Hydnomerulius pinastri MD-312 TaxID=994086 RepID=A0A0C9WG80_9AGAM|nr:hypothetical protein HYDPIDRAFT_111667 [Hydnomerulius pinastri MD-312]